MIASRLRSEARGGSTTGSSSRYGSGVYGGRIQHANDPDLKRALQYSYASQAVRKWEKRWVTIHDTSMRVHKWMPAPVSSLSASTSQLPLKTTIDKTPNIIPDQQQERETESMSMATQDTQIIDEESTSQSSQN